MGSGAARWEGSAVSRSEGSGLDQLGQALGWGRGRARFPPLPCEVWSFPVLGALEVVDDALERQSPEALLEALRDPALGLQGVRRDFADWYLEQLSSDREQKAQVRLHLSPAPSV